MRHAANVEKLELVSTSLQLPPSRQQIPQPPRGAVPKTEGLLWAVEGQSLNAVTSNGADAARVWILDTQWQMIGEVKPPLRARQEPRQIVALWDGRGERLLVSVMVDDRPPYAHYVGVVAPPDVTLTWIASEFRDMSDFGWLPDGDRRAFVLARDGQWQTLMIADPEDGKATSHRVAKCDERIALWDVLASPDGTRAAFERVGDSRDHTLQLGVLLLDLLTGEVGEITSEDTKRYVHQPWKWESPVSLLFTRRTDGPYPEVWRARLRPRAASTPP